MHVYLHAEVFTRVEKPMEAIRGPEEGVGSSGARVTGGCELPDVCVRN